jgi:hypothetical protein
VQFGREERWGLLVKKAGLAGSFGALNESARAWPSDLTSVSH